ncbi:NAD(P)-binding protein [Hypoxylon sp. NC1633]|nr:NAD(P)-binding protein [Hypoxylon sp. NC1633]
MKFEIPTVKLTPTYHRESYASISPQRPELSQAGKAVLITGGTTGIGYAIARSFIQARARKVVVLGRRPETCAAAAASLTKEAEALAREAGGSATKVIGYPCDVGNRVEVAALWGRIAGEKETVDVLVLNAVAVSPAKPILELGADRIWQDYDVNVRGSLDMAERLYKQVGGGKKYLIHVSTLSIHYWAASAQFPGYGLTKNAAAAALQAVAQDSTEKMQVLIYHPGAHFTESAEKSGIARADFDWDDINLPGDFAVWAATPEAAFLHGRFVWAHWDVDEMKTLIRKRIDEDPDYLKVGVKGL